MALMCHAVLVLLLAASSSLASAQPAAQADSLAVHFSPGAGTFVGSETVTLSVQATAAIHYTLDGSTPTVMSPIYRGPLTLEKSTRLRAVAIVPDAPAQGPVATAHGQHAASLAGRPARSEPGAATRVGSKSV